MAKTGKDCKYACVIDMCWSSPSPQAPKITYTPVKVKCLEDDERVRQVVDRHHKKLEVLNAARLFVASEPLAIGDPKSKPSSLTARLLTAVRHSSGADIAFVVGGTIRGELIVNPGDSFSYNDLLGTFPFETEMVALPIPGSILQSAYEFGVDQVKNGEEGNDFVQVGHTTGGSLSQCCAVR